MKVVIAIDSFKGSLTSVEAGRAAAAGVKDVFPDAETVVVPMADGGEGTVDVFLHLRGCEAVRVTVTGPLGGKVTARYGILPNGKTAVMEIAQVIGLALVPPEQRNPLHTSSFGVGEMIRDALERGYRDIILGIGGSSTNDGGLGMLTALGARFCDADGRPVGVTGRDLGLVARAELGGLDPRLADCRIRVACDVDNPLCGPRGASAVFGEQKGATGEIIRYLEEALARFARTLTACGCPDIADRKGAGAAGGLGYALALLPCSSLEPGAPLLAEAAGLEAQLAGADCLITGEGRIDAQTSMGKCPSAVARLGKRAGVPVLAVGGSLAANAVLGGETGIDAAFSIVPGPCTLAEAMVPGRAAENLRRTVGQIFRLLRAMR